jgi:predicted  nucleic acid-binding Zn-ribbon protein
MDKLDHWAEDRRTALKVELEELDLQIRETRKAARLARNLPAKLECQRALRRLEAQRDEAWRSYDEASREIDRQKDALLDEISGRLGKKFGTNTEANGCFHRTASSGG